VPSHREENKRLFVLKVGNEMSQDFENDCWDETKTDGKDRELEIRRWANIRSLVISRDNRTCTSCEKTFPAKDLTVHHVVPRREGGSDELDNLVTLCPPCHDEIEGLDFRTKISIAGYKADPAKNKESYLRELSEERRLMHERLDAERPEWHKYVYGGQKRQPKQ
jgi:predicted HNH restriction endonuclease